MKCIKRISKVCLGVLLALTLSISGLVQGADSRVEAAVLNSSYAAIRPYMKYGNYGSNGYESSDYWSCAGWVSRVLYTAGLGGKLGGYIPNFGDYAVASASGLEKFMRSDNHFTCVAYYNDDYGPNAANKLLSQIESGNIKAGDIIIYYGYGARIDNSGTREHASIILPDKFNGRTSNNNHYGEDRWGRQYIGHPTVAHSHNYQYGVEFYTPIDGHLYVDDATGYAVYRIKEGNILEGVEKPKLSNATKNTGEVKKATYNGVKAWRYVKNGKVDPSYTGFAPNQYGIWYLNNGRVDFSANGVFKGYVDGELAWWYVEGGKVTFKDTVAKNQYGWWYVNDGKVDFSFTGFEYNKYGLWYINSGKVNFGANGVYKGYVDGELAWWYVKNGEVTYTDTVAKNQYGWWAVTDGKVDFSVNGFAQNQYGWFVIEGGKVNFGVNGYRYGYVNGKYGIYKVKNGQVIK